MYLIGFTGPAGCGKDFIADLVAIRFGQFGRTSDKTAFAKPLKEACKILFDLTDEDVYVNKERITDWSFPRPQSYQIEHTMTVRDILQYFGTDIMRNNWSQNFWVEKMIRKIKKCETDVLLITDVRFDNEAKIILASGGCVVDILRRPHEKIKQQHVSEFGIGALYKTHFICNDVHDLGYVQIQVRDLVSGITHGTL